MKTNTHGLKMHGLRKAAGDTKGLNGYYSGQYVQINYDTVEGWYGLIITIALVTAVEHITIVLP